MKVKLKTFLEFLKKAFWNKSFMMLFIGAILGALSMKVPEETLTKFICALPGMSGCETTVSATTEAAK